LFQKRPSWLPLCLGLLFVSMSAHPAAAQTSPDSSAHPTGMNPAAPVPPVVQATPTAPDYPRGKISGLAFGDYYYNAQGDPTHHYNAAGVDSGKTYIDGLPPIITKDLNGIQIRRIYFTLDNDLNAHVSTRFRLEADSKSLTSDGKIGVAVKTAFVQWKQMLKRSDSYFGLQATPIWDDEEGFWQYRSIEKTQADFRGLGNAYDLGVALRGFADSDHHIGYWGMLGNGNGQKTENNQQKKAYLSLPLTAGDLRLEPFVDYEDVHGGQDRATYKIFAGYTPKPAWIAVDVVDRVNHQPGKPNQEPFGVSAFAHAPPNRKLGWFVRYDLWKPDRRAKNRVDQNLYIAGLDWMPYQDFHIMPNVEAMQYTSVGTGVTPTHNEMQARLTFYYLFSKPQS
jgi:hypothetical protein